MKLALEKMLLANAFSEVLLRVYWRLPPPPTQCYVKKCSDPGITIRSQAGNSSNFGSSGQDSSC